MGVQGCFMKTMRQRFSLSAVSIRLHMPLKCIGIFAYSAKKAQIIPIIYTKHFFDFIMDTDQELIKVCYAFKNIFFPKL